MTDLNHAQRAEIAQRCQAVVIAAAYATDQRDFDALAALFTRDAQLIRPTANGEPLVGREAIKAAYEAKPATRLTRHFCAPSHVEIESAQAATASTYAQVFGANTQENAHDDTFGFVMDDRLIVGEFNDRFTYVDGQWLIAERDARFVLYRER